MCAIELVRDPQTREPAGTETKAIAKFCYEHGLITITAGTFNNVIRILVPVVVTDEQLDEGLAVIESALASIAEHKQPVLSHAQSFKRLRRLPRCIVVGQFPTTRLIGRYHLKVPIRALIRKVGYST